MWSVLQKKKKEKERKKLALGREREKYGGVKFLGLWATLEEPLVPTPRWAPASGRSTNGIKARLRKAPFAKRKTRSSSQSWALGPGHAALKCSHLS